MAEFRVGNVYAVRVKLEVPRQSSQARRRDFYVMETLVRPGDNAQQGRRYVELCDTFQNNPFDGGVIFHRGIPLAGTEADVNVDLMGIADYVNTRIEGRSKHSLRDGVRIGERRTPFGLKGVCIKRDETNGRYASLHQLCQAYDAAHVTEENSNHNIFK
jgi:hypothetical protein